MAPGRSPAGRLFLPFLGMLAIVLLVWWPETAPPADPLDLDRPLVEEPEAADPLPQAFALTAIVISFGLTAFLLALAFRSRDVHGSDDLETDGGAR